MTNFKDHFALIYGVYDGLDENGFTKRKAVLEEIRTAKTLERVLETHVHIGPDTTTNSGILIKRYR